MDDYITIDVDGLREDMKDACLCAYFGGGIDVALLDAGDIERADAEELVELAERMGINWRKYII